MLSMVLTAGMLVGAAIGAVHAVGVYSARLATLSDGRARPDGRARLVAVYSAAWTFFLWTLFGSYLLVLWAVSVPIWLGSKALKAV